MFSEASGLVPVVVQVKHQDIANKVETREMRSPLAVETIVAWSVRKLL